MERGFKEISVSVIIPDFDSIWSGEKALEQHKKINGKECYCVHSCFQNKNVMFNPALYGSIIKSFFYEARTCNS